MILAKFSIFMSYLGVFRGSFVGFWKNVGNKQTHKKIIKMSRKNVVNYVLYP